MGINVITDDGQRYNGHAVRHAAPVYRMGDPSSPGKASGPQTSARRSSTPTVSGAASAGEGRSNLGDPGYLKNGQRTRHDDCLRFGTLNCRTLASDAAIEQLLQANRKANLDIVAVQETKSRTLSCTKTKNGELLILGGKVEGKNIGGVGFLINRSMQHAMDSFEIVNARLGILRLDLGPCGKLVIINVYAPTSNADEDELDKFYRSLENAIKQEKAYHIYVLGDFNVIMGKCEATSDRHGKHGLGVRNENGERLADLLASRKLYHGNSLFEKPEKRRWTWKSANGATMNEIDHVLTNRKGTILDVAVLPSFDVGSDHRLVRAKIRISRKTMKRDLHKPTRPKRPTYDPETLEKNILKHHCSQADDPTADYTQLCDGLLRCAEPAAKPTSELSPRLDQRAKELLKKRGEIKRNPSSTHLDQLLINKACRMAIEESLRERRKKALIKTAEQRQSIRKKRFELSDRTTTTTALRDKNGQLRTSRTEIENLTVEFYTRLFKSNIAVPRTPTPPPEDEPPILADEVYPAIRKLKSGTAAGPDKIPTELLKSGGDALNHLLAQHFSYYLKKGLIPGQWKESKTILIPKKGDLNDLNNYRPISLLSVVYKLFMKIILNRLEKTLDDFQPPSQAGFRRNFSCLDHIHTLTQVVERHREYQLPLAVAFVDYYKAFDSVEINAVLNSLTSAGVPSKYIELIAVCNEKTTTTIQLFDRKLLVPIGKGVRQGDKISPKLFAAALQDAMRQLDWDSEKDWEDNTAYRGINIDGKVLTNLRFADDIALLASSTADLTTMLNELDSVGKKIGLTMNRKKTQWMKNRFCDNGHVILDGTDLQEFDTYTYLGRDINMQNDLKTEIRRRRKAGWAAFNSIREVTNQLKDPGLRAQIFEASVIPALCYASEAWPETKGTSTALRTSYRALERALLGTSRLQQWHQNQRSTDLRQKSQIRDIEEHISRGKHRWAGHVARRTDDRWSTRVTHWIPRDKKRPLGRPPTRWDDHFRKTISQEGRHWTTIAKDRDAWKSCGPR